MKLNLSKCFVRHKNWVVNSCWKYNSHRLYKNRVFVSKRIETKMSKRDTFKNVLDSFVQHHREWNKNFCRVLYWRIPFCVEMQTWVLGFDKKNSSECHWHTLYEQSAGVCYQNIETNYIFFTLIQWLFFSPVFWIQEFLTRALSVLFNNVRAALTQSVQKSGYGLDNGGNVFRFPSCKLRFFSSSKSLHK